jgi:hypothetical protein
MRLKGQESNTQPYVVERGNPSRRANLSRFPFIGRACPLGYTLIREMKVCVEAAFTNDHPCVVAANALSRKAFRKQVVSGRAYAILDETYEIDGTYENLWSQYFVVGEFTVDR